MFMRSIECLFRILNHSIRILGDPEYQERVWIKGEGKEVDDYDDAFVEFTDRCEEIFENPGSYDGVDETVLNALRVLYDKVSKFDDEIARITPLGDAELIKIAEWQEIQQLARDTYKMIKKHLDEKGY